VSLRRDYRRVGKPARAVRLQSGSDLQPRFIRHQAPLMRAAPHFFASICFRHIADQAAHKRDPVHQPPAPSYVLRSEWRIIRFRI